MQNGFQISARLCISKDKPSHFVSPQETLRADNFVAEPSPDLLKRRLPRFDNLARDVIRIDNVNSKPRQVAGGGRFSHANPACESDRLQGRASISRITRDFHRKML
jgi:hypothetical protein